MLGPVHRGLSHVPDWRNPTPDPPERFCHDTKMLPAAFAVPERYPRPYGFVVDRSLVGIIVVGEVPSIVRRTTEWFIPTSCP